MRVLPSSPVLLHHPSPWALGVALRSALPPNPHPHPVSLLLWVPRCTAGSRGAGGLGLLLDFRIVLPFQEANRCSRDGERLPNLGRDTTLDCAAAVPRVARFPLACSIYTASSATTWESSSPGVRSRRFLSHPNVRFAVAASQCPVPFSGPDSARTRVLEWDSDGVAGSIAAVDGLQNGRIADGSLRSSHTVPSAAVVCSDEMLAPKRRPTRSRSSSTFDDRVPASLYRQLEQLRSRLA